jgi:hypothetical protein
MLYLARPSWYLVRTDLLMRAYLTIPTSISRPVRVLLTRNSRKWITRQHGFVPESAWILHRKEQFGLVAPGTAPAENPCPQEKVAAIKQAFRRFGLL